MEMEINDINNEIFTKLFPRNFIIYHFLVKSKPYERIDLLITTSEYLPDKKNPVVMKACFSEGKLMKQFGNPPLAKRTPPFN